LRARKKKWAEKEISINDSLIESPENYKGKWNEYFNNLNPLYVEIGCGKGRFIAESASANREINYLGIEREKQVIISGMRRAREQDIKNVGFILSDVNLLPEIFFHGEIGRLYINFCDPWPNRKKWVKRRLTHANFLNIYRPLLNGRLHLKTDNRELFEFSLSQFAENGWTVVNIFYDLHGGGDPPSGIMTEYEEKFYNENVPVMYCEAYVKNDPRFQERDE